MPAVAKKKKKGTFPQPAPKGNKYAVGNKGGQPTLYRPEYVEQARQLCQLGATDVEMARFFKVTPQTFYLWKATHREFSEAVVAGKAISDERMKRAHYQRGIGYDVPVVKIKEQRIGRGKSAKLVVVERTTSATHIPGDVGAQKNWLANRCPKEWRDSSVGEDRLPQTAAEATEDLIQFLIDHGVRIAPPLIEGVVDESREPTS